MAIKVITPPAVEPLTLEEVKKYLKIDSADDDLILTNLITQAREYCEDYQARKYITQTLELVLDSFPTKNYIDFRACSPVQNVESVKYYDVLGIEHELEASDYIFDNDSFINRIILNYCKMWPLVMLQAANSVRIRFTAGYGEPNDVPETVKLAMIFQIKLLYDDYKPDEREKLEKTRDALLSMNRAIPL